MDFTSPFNPSSSFSEMTMTTSDRLPPAHLASLLNSVSPSRISSRPRSMGWIATLCDELHSVIQPLLRLLSDIDHDVRLAAASALGKFAEQRESQPDIIATSLIWMDSGAS